MRRITRSQAIDDLRRTLIGMVDEEESLCAVAARRKLFCHGFARWSTAELERRFPWLVRREQPGLLRAHLELLANRWQLGRQDVRAGELPCDAGAREGIGSSRSPCHGWEEFYEGELARFHRELCGEEVQVVPDGLLAPPDRQPAEV